MRVSRKLSSQQYPLAMAKGTEVLVIGPDGATTILQEMSQRRAQKAARRVQRLLQATDYVKQQLADAIDKITQDLIDMNIPPDHIDELLWDGYNDVKAMILQLREQATLLYLK